MVSRFNFRIYDTKNNKIIYPDGNGYIDFDNEDCIIDGFGILCGIESNIVKDDYILMQSTGLEDKNWKEIFEGDIVKIINTNEILPVKYYDNFCRFGLKVEQDGTRSAYYDLDKKIAKDIEVIGNIYKNKELIK